MPIDPISGFNWEHDAKSDTFKMTVTEKLFQQIVNEEDEYTLNMIEEYIKSAKSKGECIAARIIPEGKLRHIINMGLTMYNKDIQTDEIPSTELFPQEQYIEFLRREMLRLENENQRLRNEIKFGGDTDEE